MTLQMFDWLLEAPMDCRALDHKIEQLRTTLETLEQCRDDSAADGRVGTPHGADTARSPTWAAQRDMASAVRNYLASRRARASIINGSWFSDPAWDLLLDLFVCRIEGRPIAVSAACIAAEAPWTTALRWITKLLEAGAIHRTGDPNDGRRSLIWIDEQVAIRVERWVRCYLLSERDVTLPLSASFTPEMASP